VGEELVAQVARHVLAEEVVDEGADGLFRGGGCVEDFLAGAG
jgi:hypothetical protein